MARLQNVEVLRVTNWLVRCRIASLELWIPRAYILEPVVLVAGMRTNLKLSSWFADEGVLAKVEQASPGSVFRVASP